MPRADRDEDRAGRRQPLGQRVRPARVAPGDQRPVQPRRRLHLVVEGARDRLVVAARPGGEHPREFGLDVVGFVDHAGEKRALIRLGQGIEEAELDRRRLERLDRLARGGELRLEPLLDALIGRESELGDRPAAQDQRRRPSLHRVEPRHAARLDQPGELGALLRRDAIGQRRQTWAHGEPREQRRAVRRIADQCLDHQPIGLRHRLAQQRVLPPVARRQRMDRAEQIDRGVGVGEPPQRRMRRALRGGGGRARQQQQRSDQCPSLHSRLPGFA